MDAGLWGGTSADPGVGKEAGARGSSARLTGERMQRLLLWTEEERERGSEKVQGKGAKRDGGQGTPAGR